MRTYIALSVLLLLSIPLAYAAPACEKVLQKHLEKDSSEEYEMQRNGYFIFVEGDDDYAFFNTPAGTNRELTIGDCDGYNPRGTIVECRTSGEDNQLYLCNRDGTEQIYSIQCNGGLKNQNKRVDLLRGDLVRFVVYNGKEKDYLNVEVWECPADADSDGFLSRLDGGDDCDDSNANIHPGATEVCNAKDDNCDGQTDEGLGTAAFRDSDADTYGDPNNVNSNCQLQPGYVANDDDCDDTNPAVKPGVPEICGDSIDNNCNGEQDEAAECAEANPTLCAASGGTWVGLPADGACCGNVDDEYFVKWPRLAEPDDVDYATGCWNSNAVDNDATVTASLISHLEEDWRYEPETYFEVRSDGARREVLVLAIEDIGTRGAARQHIEGMEPGTDYVFTLDVKTRSQATAEISLLTLSAEDSVQETSRQLLLTVPPNTDWQTYPLPEITTGNGPYYGMEIAVTVPAEDRNAAAYFDNLELYHKPAVQVLNWAGQYYGCKVTDAATISRDDTDRPGQQRIVDNGAEFCAVQGSWFCGYRNRWEEGGDRNTTSGAPPNAAQYQEEGFLQTQCCAQNQCWDGYACVDSVDLETNPLAEPTMVGEQAYVCVDGAWQTAAPKDNQDGTEQGYCGAEQCFFSRVGENPRCVADGFWDGDDYCDTGNWTSRTRMVALALVELAGTGDYTLFCDTPARAANRLDYPIPPDSMAWKFLFGDNPSEVGYFLCDELPEGMPCANNLCVIRWDNGEKVTFGTALNEPIDKSFDYSILNLFPEAQQSTAAGYFDYCDAAKAKSEEEGGYWGCKGRTAVMRNTNANIWYNHALQSVVFSEQSIRVGGTNLAQLFANILEGPFRWITRFITDLFSSRSSASEFAFIDGKVGDYRTLYLSKQGNREIKAAEEQIGADTLTTVNYYSYQVDVCRAVEEYCRQNANSGECFGAISCQPTIAGDTMVFNVEAKNIPASSDFWGGLTAAVRTKDATAVDGEVQFTPMIAAEPSLGAIALNQPFTVSVGNAASAPAGILGYVWDFGDGTTLSTRDPAEQLSHRYTRSGSYRIRAKAIDQFFNIHESNSIVVRV